MAISTPSLRYIELEEERSLPRALMAGTKEMIAQGRKFTPQHPAEEDATYSTRLNSTTLYNGYSDTIKKQAGKIFASPIILNEDVPEFIRELAENIDGQGRNLHNFFYDAFKDALVDGISLVYVDFPKIKKDENQLITNLDVMIQGARPNTILINASNFISIESEIIDGIYQPTKIRIREYVTENKDDYTYQDIEQIRSLSIGAWEIYRKGDKGEWVVYDEGSTGLDYIPIVPIYTNRVGFYEGEPAHKELAELNRAHWISSSEQAHALSFARFAIMVLAGVHPDTKIGSLSPDRIIKIENEAAKWGLLETSGSGIEQGRLDIESIEKRMETAGMTVRIETATGTTATAAKINSADGDSILLSWGQSLEDSINKVLEIMGDYLNKSAGTVNVNVKLPSDTPEGSAEDINRLHISSLCSQKGAIMELKRRNVYDKDMDVEEELQLINDQPPAFIE